MAGYRQQVTGNTKRGTAPSSACYLLPVACGLQRGFTLIELVTTMTLSGIIATFVVMFIAGPMQTYAAQTRRAALVDSADGVLRLMSRDIRAALPNSVRTLRTSNVVALELLSTVDAARYRDNDATAADDELDFTASDTRFTVMGQFDVARPFSRDDHYLAVYNVGIAGANAYELTNVITPADTQITIEEHCPPPLAAGCNEDRVTLGTPVRFMYGSPGQRIFLVSGPVTYLCNESTGELRRLLGYSIAATQTADASDLLGRGASSELVATNVTNCDFAYDPGAAHRAGLVSMSVTIARDDERVRLLHQVHVENTP